MLVMVGAVALVPRASAAPVNAPRVPVRGVATSNGEVPALPVVGTFTPTDLTGGTVTGVFNGTIAGGPVTNAPVTGVLQQTPGTCRVLDLRLGPLDVNLSDLRIQLNEVHLRITAQRGGGILGDLLGGLAGG
jgi:hypothetical protein